jgi:GxxExxY protein
MDHDHVISDRIIGAAIEVHRQLGPGLLETPYKRALNAPKLINGLKRVVL